MFKLVTVLGATAVGKTKIAAALSYKFNGEIISADSRQVYKGMDLGTGKDYADYFFNNSQIPYHLIDVVTPNEEFNIYDFKKLFIEKLQFVSSKNKTPFLVGGSGLYLSTILQNYKLKQTSFEGKRKEELESLNLEELQKIYLGYIPEPHVKKDLLEKDRLVRGILVHEESDEKVISLPEIEHLVLGVSFPREIIRERIEKRLKERLLNGLIEEVETLLKIYPKERMLSFGLEYKWITNYLFNEISYEELFENLNRAIAKFAKRQMTWFRKMEREGVNINWVSEYEEAEHLTKEFLINKI